MGPKEALEAWLTSIERLDPRTIVDTLADDVELSMSELARPLVGKEAFCALVGSMGDMHDFFQIEREMVVESGREVAALVRVQTKLCSDVVVMGEKLPLGGKEGHSVDAVFLKVNSQGKIASIVRIRDNLALALRLGIPVQQIQSLLRKIEQSLLV
jgi:hypothetical protein